MGSGLTSKKRREIYKMPSYTPSREEIKRYKEIGKGLWSKEKLHWVKRVISARLSQLLIISNIISWVNGLGKALPSYAIEIVFASFVPTGIAVILSLFNICSYFSSQSSN